MLSRDQHDLVDCGEWVNVLEKALISFVWTKALASRYTIQSAEADNFSWALPAFCGTGWAL